jgi:hypothetical protein
MRQRRIGLPILVVLLGVLSACGQSDGDGSVATASGAATPSASASGGSSQYAKALDFAKCMRGNGLPDFPDPDATGGMNLGGSGIDRNSTQFKNGMEACQDLLPDGGEKTAANTEQVAQMGKYAKCMRDNGLPDFPDPGPDGFDPGSFNTKDPAFAAAQNACKQFLTWR